MKIKGLLFMSLIVLAIVLSASAVSAGWFDGDVEIDGMKFNVPSGYDEGKTDDYSVQNYMQNDANDYKNYNVETKVFEMDTPDPEHPGMAVYPHYLVISVISDTKDLSLDDVINRSDYQQKTINNKAGLDKISDNSNNKKIEEFYYLEDGKLVRIYLYDPEGIGIENIIVK